MGHSWFLHTSLCMWALWVSIFCLIFGYGALCSDVAQNGTVYVNGESAIGKTDRDFICATLDWWPPEKCDYGTCAWGNASLLNLNLSNVVFLNAIKEFSHLKIRLGGTLQDKVIYQTNDKEPCHPFALNNSKEELFSFTQGCLPLSRWDELNEFFKKSGAVIIFGLNALFGRTILPNSGTAIGAWNSTNAEFFMRYTVRKGYPIHGWELGNELSGNGIGVSVAAGLYANDTINLQNIVRKIYNHSRHHPLNIAPGGFFNGPWFKEFVQKANNSLDVITHHIYNLGPGNDEHLIERVIDPSYLDGEADTFKQLRGILNDSGTGVHSWVGEAGGAYNSGGHNVSNRFVYSFWYLDQLGMSASYNTKVYCRQTLIGGNYGLLNTTNFHPNPDYYSALLWHRLMGKHVLSTSFNGTKKIRAYTHCAKKRGGITLLLINLDGNTTVNVNIECTNGTVAHHMSTGCHWGHKRGTKMTRQEYHLTAKDGDLHSQTVLLNGNELSVNASSGRIPDLEPRVLLSHGLITVAPYSIVFAHMPYVDLPACKYEW